MVGFGELPRLGTSQGWAKGEGTQGITMNANVPLQDNYVDADRQSRVIIPRIGSQSLRDGHRVAFRCLAHRCGLQDNCASRMPPRASTALLLL